VPSCRVSNCGMRWFDSNRLQLYLFLTVLNNPFGAKNYLCLV
jgi:hypothetical protein